MTLLLTGFEKLAEFREERKRICEEARAEGLAAGLAEGLAEGRAERRIEGRTQGMAESNEAWEAWAGPLMEESKTPLTWTFPIQTAAPNVPGNEICRLAMSRKYSTSSHVTIKWPEDLTTSPDGNRMTPVLH